MNGTVLTAGEVASDIGIRARDPWNATGLTLEAGGTYHCTAAGQWRDWKILTDADGFDSPGAYMRLFERLRRVRDQPWFRLIGSIDRDMSTAVAIGSDGTLTPETTGELICFANDVPRTYWNNRGEVTLTVTRTA